MQKTDTYCPINTIPFRGVNCSDAAGHQMEFYEFMKLADSGAPLNGVQWDENTQSPFFNMVGDGEMVYQIWFDNATSLAVKYSLAKEMGIRGVGPFSFNFVDNTGQKSGNPNAPKEAQLMWDALRTFKQNSLSKKKF